MKILLLIETLTAGGAETFVLRLANALAPQNEVAVAVLHGGQIEPQLAQGLHPQIALHRLHTPAERWWWRADRVLRGVGLDRSPLRWRQRRWLRQLVDDFRPDIVHSHLLKADRLMLEVTRGRIIGRVTTLHGDYEPYLRGQADPQMRGADRWIIRVLEEADAIVGVCRAHLQSAERLLPSIGTRLRLIYNGYERVGAAEHPSFTPPDGMFRFGMVSRGVRLKGWRRAVEAFARVRDGSSRLVLVGDGPAIAELRAEQPSDVEFVGFSARPADWIARFDVCLLPTLFPHESLPTAVIEYLASGKPVIATDVGEIRTMLTAPDGRLAGTLLTFRGEDVDVDELAAAMVDLRADPQRRAAMGQAATGAFERFQMELCVASYEKLYREVARASLSRPAPRG
ncbi:glycosyltransferase family 4 protein [Sphingomonas sp. BN140010]|uniref:Glycosyltransferase family 4 protein n=1 Tax=Sphingomonas arvum TaxID=2992113 RepID=A0ABT3JEN8_9SPHN|nr:glycosyltransferase family 4 protein [Sphingomonas sp. BN140010]MCW3797514.1 glycosyltransferase family 4 protein [Sphingomonas sp. BN140010]